MKRIQLKNQVKFLADQLPEDLPEDLTDYVTQLKLLYGVPFSYLITDESALPPESLRFFHVDGNWTQALAEGAMSIGKDSPEEAASDKIQLRHTSAVASKRLRTVRMKKMHENHKKMLRSSDMLSASNIQSGFIMRSCLTRRMKGLEVIGSNAGKPLEILRMESLSTDVLICIFDGEVTDLIIAEPKLGLRFGAPNDSRLINVRCIDDNENFGKNTGQTVNLNEFTDSNGRLHAAKFAEKLGIMLSTDIGSAQVAFELIATAHRAEFMKK